MFSFSGTSERFHIPEKAIKTINTRWTEHSQPRGGRWDWREGQEPQEPQELQRQDQQQLQGQRQPHRVG